MSLLESAASGDRLKALQDLREIIATQLVACDSARDVAALTARFQSVLLEIETMTKESGKAADPVDEISARRAARGGSTARAGRAARGSS